MWGKSILGIGCVLVALMTVAIDVRGGFVETRGSHFLIDERPFYFNGFNAYWLMYMATDPSTRNKVTDTFVQASKYGMTVARTWAFSDGGYRALQTSPGVYNEDVFNGLDFVISEARKYGIHLILSLVNNWEAFGGKSQYAQWARDKGQSLNNTDDFFRNAIIKGYYKNHIKAVLTRVNSITGVTYKDDPNIFAWELMNEPRCQSDLSGKTIQDWVFEMSTYVKSIDDRHLLEVGLEGFYGESKPQKKLNNPGYQVGTDFIANNLLPQVDFTTIHLYPELWIPGSSGDAQVAFVNQWMKEHMEDAMTVIRKPLVLTEFGKSSKSNGFTIGARDMYLENIYDIIYGCATSGGSCGGALFWQVMAERMEKWSDGYDVVLEQNPSTDAVISLQSARVASLST